MSGPPRAEGRVRRLLVMLPWLMERDEVPLSDVAARFGVSEQQVAKDLELVAMCGLPPYVDEMIDVFIDDGIVHVGVPRLFTRPLRLTTPEAFSVLAAGRLALELPGVDRNGPLARALEKLSTAVRTAVGHTDADHSVDDTAGVAIDIARPPYLDELADAVADGAELEVRYYSASRDDTADRVVQPRHVFVSGGAWYLLADDGRSSARRTFRIDRIESCAPTGRRFDVVDVEPPTQFFADADLPRARLAVAERSLWAFDPVPVDDVVPLPEPPAGVDATRDAQWWQVTMPVAAERWLTEMLLRLGPDAHVIEPGDARQRVAVAAHELRSLYRASDEVGAES